MPLASVAVTTVALWGTARLPGVLATHWGVDGRANGSTGLAAFRVITVIVVALGAVALIWAGFQQGAPSSRVKVTAGAGAFFSVLTSLLSWNITAANRGSSDWHRVAQPALWSIIGVVVAGLLAGGLAMAWSHGLRAAATAARSPETILALASGERAVWVSSAHNRLMFVASLALVGVGVAVGLDAGVWIGAILIIAGALMAALSTITVRVDAGGLTIRYGMIPGLRTRHRLEEIDRAETIDVRPMKWGGWGYRGSLKALDRAAVVVRGGEGIRLLISGGKEFAVTVDDAAIGAALLNGLRHQRQSTV